MPGLLQCTVSQRNHSPAVPRASFIRGNVKVTATVNNQQAALPMDMATPRTLQQQERMSVAIVSLGGWGAPATPVRQ